VNCVPDSMGCDGCSGGQPLSVYQYMMTCPMPDDSCQAYVAKQSDDCAWIHQCGTCTEDGCVQVKSYDKYWVDDYSSVNGVTDMKKEIFARGIVSACCCVCQSCYDDVCVLVDVCKKTSSIQRFVENYDHIHIHTHTLFTITLQVRYRAVFMCPMVC